MRRDDKIANIELLQDRVNYLEEIVDKQKEDIRKAKIIVNTLLNSRTFKAVHLLNRFRKQFLLGTIGEKKKFLSWIYRRSSTYTDGDQRFQPLYAIMDCLSREDHTPYIVGNLDLQDDKYILTGTCSSRQEKINSRLKRKPLYIHSHHKCASLWALAYFKEFARLNNLTFFQTVITNEVRDYDFDVIFFGNSSYEMASKYELDGIHFVRNPLNLLISAYYSHLSTHPIGNWTELIKQRSLLQKVDLQTGLLLTIPFLEREDINTGAIGPFSALRNWDFSDERFLTIRIEDFVLSQDVLKSTKGFESYVLPDSESFTFSKFSGGREPNQVDSNSHYRSGSPEEWKKYNLTGIHDYVRIQFADLLCDHYPEVVLYGLDLCKPFFALDPITRRALTSHSLKQPAEAEYRWLSLDHNESSGWITRARMAADFLDSPESVADLGCGTMQLEQFLPASCKYIPVDLMARDSRTIICNFNKQTVAVSADTGAILGLLEYLLDVKKFLLECRGLFQRIVVSYNCKNSESIHYRREMGWVNDFTESEIESLFIATSFAIIQKKRVDPSQMLWLLG